MKTRRFILFVLITLLSSAAYSQSMADKENVIAQMNYCVNSLTNIINNGSMTTLTYEADQLLNNLTMTDVRGLDEIQDFRTSLHSTLKDLQITEQEKSIISRVQEIKSKNLMWQSLSSALNPTMLITGGGKPGPQIAFQAIVAAARTAVDYQAMRGENEIEEIQAMWTIKKAKMTSIGDLRSKALSATFKLYDKYHYLGEWDRLTEKTAEAFNKIINEPVAAKRVRLLLDKENVYGMLADYYYHLGMAYLGDAPDGSDADYDNAKKYLIKYQEKYSKAPIFRYDHHSGIVALTRLAYERDLPGAYKEKLIQDVLDNLPDNGPAIFQCAMIYIYELNKAQRGYDLLRRGIDNECSNTDVILAYLMTNIDDVKRYTSTYADICSAIDNSRVIGLNQYIPFLIAQSNDVKESLNQFLSIKHYKKGSLLISLIPDKVYDCFGITAYGESAQNGTLTSQQFVMNPEDSYTTDELKKKVKVFARSGNENLLFSFFDPVVSGERYCVKNEIDYNKIINKEFEGNDKYPNLTNSDLKSIAKFCRKHKKKTPSIEMRLTLSGDDLEEKVQMLYNGQSLPAGASFSTYTRESEQAQQGLSYDFVYKGTDSIKYNPIHFYGNEYSEMLTLVFSDIFGTIVKYVNNDNKWELYSVEQNRIIEYMTPISIKTKDASVVEKVKSKFFSKKDKSPKVKKQKAPKVKKEKAPKVKKQKAPKVKKENAPKVKKQKAAKVKKEKAPKVKKEASDTSSSLISRIKFWKKK